MDNFKLPVDNILGKVKTVKTKLTWCIKDISANLNLPEINSPTFTAKTGDTRTKWMLVLINSHDDEQENQNADGDEKYLDLHLTCLNTKTVRATVSVSILNSTLKKVKQRLVYYHKFEPGVAWEIKNYIELKHLSDKKSKYTSNDRLTIVFTIMINEVSYQVQKAKARIEALQQVVLFKRLENLFYERKFSDIVFVVEGQEIHVHKCILANRSSVFEAMFTFDMSESRNNRVEISDITYTAMFHLLQYIYTGDVPEYDKDIKKSYMELLIAAEKYCLDDLKNECEEQLADLLQVDNIFEHLNFSETYNASHLKEKVMDFIVNHGEEIVALPSFKERCGELSADVVSEVFRALVVKKRKIE